MNRRISFILIVALTVGLLAPSPASAQTEAELKAQLEALKDDAREAGDAYSEAHWALDETEVQITRTDRRLKATGARLAAAKKRLATHAEAIYRRESLDLFSFLVGASSFEDFVTRLDYLSRIGESQAQTIAEVKDLGERLTSQRRQLAKERKRRSSDLESLRERRDRLQSRLKAKEADFRQLKAKLDAVRSGGSVPRGVAAVAGPNGMVFPVVGSYYYSDTWGASRSGGRRRHQGTDIMAPRGTPVVAILSGTVRSKTNNLGGKTIWLKADNGWEFYYAHLDAWVVKSGRVKAGQVIATVGSTGNASASSPHLHLQVHPGGGGPVNPYPYLKAME